jgi:hypothetical protein
MSRTSSTSAAPVVEPARSDGARSLALRTTLGTLVAVVLALAVRTAAVATDPGLVTLDPFSVVPVVGSGVVAGAGAAVVYAAAVRLTARPVRTFLVVAAVVFLAMLVPVVAVAPALGAGAAAQGWLVAMHAAVAVPLVVAVARLGRVG